MRFQHHMLMYLTLTSAIGLHCCYLKCINTCADIVCHQLSPTSFWQVTEQVRPVHVNCARPFLISRRLYCQGQRTALKSGETNTSSTIQPNYFKGESFHGFNPSNENFNLKIFVHVKLKATPNESVVSRQTVLKIWCGRTDHYYC